MPNFHEEIFTQIIVDVDYWFLPLQLIKENPDRSNFELNTRLLLDHTEKN
jgi:hypothetical protein